MNWDALFALHRDLPREGPGNDASTLRALRLLAPLPPRPVVLDLGCGPGQQTLVLAIALQTKIVGMDLHPPYLEQLRQSAAAAGLDPLIEPRVADFAKLSETIPAGSVDLIWSEGAAYSLGFENALRTWYPLLKPGGQMAVSECTWLTETPPDEPREFWKAAYPEMGTEAENCRRAEVARYEVLSTFTLPPEAWWTDYYTPMSARIALLRPSADPALTAVLDESQREIDLYRRHGSSYGYVFYLLRKQNL